MFSDNGNAVASLDPRLTLVLIAKEQPDFLRRALAWYCDLPVTIKVCDASRHADHEIAALETVEYLHSPALGEASLAARINDGLRTVVTPYVVWVDVESLLLPEALNEAVQFLDNHPGYSAAQGYSLTYEAHLDRVEYYVRDRKVLDGHDAEGRVERVERFMEQSVSLLHAVTRTPVLQTWFNALPDDASDQMLDIGHTLYLINAARVHVLAVPYALHLTPPEALARYTAALQDVLLHNDPAARAKRDAWVACVAGVLVDRPDIDEDSLHEGLRILAESLRTSPRQSREKIVSTVWNLALERGEPNFEPRQFLEMPFYTQGFFDELARVEFLVHALPAGDVQIKELEAALLRQVELSASQSNPDAESLLNRLWQAYATYPFNADIVRTLVHELKTQPRDPSSTEEDLVEQIEQLAAWDERLRAVSFHDTGSLLDRLPSGRVLEWLKSRSPEAASLQQLVARQGTRPKGSQIGILLLDLEGDVFKLQATFDSLINGHYRNFNVIVFTSGELPAVTTLQHTLHFVKVTSSNYIDRINQTVKQATSDWLMLAVAGEQFTAPGLLLAADELVGADHCRAVAVDAIHRQADGTLKPALFPDFNLDLLVGLPGFVARHWLVRRTAVVKAGGYSRDYPQALEFDLLLRLIEQGGMEGLAHLSEPVVICQAPELTDNDDERQTLIRHLRARGYQAEVEALQSGGWKIDYRHAHRPVVSILVHSQDNLADLQFCLHNLLQRTRYPRYEVLIGDNNSHSPELLAWLDEQEQLSSRIRVFRADQRMSAVAMYNQLSQQAQGEYLILLDAQSGIVNVGWIESMLNQAQRPEVGVVGAKLVDREGNVTQAGLILGFGGSVGSAFVGEPKQSEGYMQRLTVEQNYSAVSMSCLMIEKALFEGLGGLDEGNFAEAFADVDLCLKAGQAGYLTVWTPQVQVVHPGTVVQSADALEALRSKWPAAFEHDTAYNRHLSLKGSGFTLGDSSQG
ncbi:glycosyl transferase family 2 [Pseudomonas sp. Leaf127]|uniref:TIGR00180 family glycosyltransferase n=1 Tax=Pseudomonas sp. Leaf127 TaxID=1736267 RepID=UPI000702A994|nr:TIGR00180 family glycosyltransferase [Pseudomonas sp. Leaf127]KQQ57111.1 glycosyl transferase family 2 [Pseudomonas sp. Leaf127]